MPIRVLWHFLIFFYLFIFKTNSDLRCDPWQKWVRVVRPDPYSSNFQFSLGSQSNFFNLIPKTFSIKPLIAHQKFFQFSPSLCLIFRFCAIMSLISPKIFIINSLELTFYSIMPLFVLITMQLNPDSKSQT